MARSAASLTLFLALFISWPAGLVHLSSHLAPPGEREAPALSAGVAKSQEARAGGGDCPLCPSRTAQPALLASATLSSEPCVTRIASAGDVLLEDVLRFSICSRAPPPTS